MNSAVANRVLTPLPFTAVKIEDIFWAPRIATNRERTLQIEYEQCRDTGRLDAFRLQWKPGQQPVPHIFWDSDVAKWVETASYTLATHPNPVLDQLLDGIIAQIAAAQQPDGYLNTHFTQVEPEKRWTNLRDWHELYCAGHLIEAAIAHYQATGKRSLLDVLCRYADYIATVFGRGEGQKRGYPGHEEIELALVKLYHVTQEEKYLLLAQYFIDERGQQPYYYDQEALARGEDPATFFQKTYSYMQADRPVRELSEVAGHAVRAMYLYSGMADMAGETGDIELMSACNRLWDDLNQHKLYLTGGLGPSRHNEGFTFNYDLPNETAYAETCAAVGLIFWAQRMLQFRCDGRYADVMEKALYNGALAGVSLDGERFFYENPLASLGSHHRQPWFDCACCPPNIARLLASLGGYVYSYNENEIAVHLYVQGNGQFQIHGQPVTLHQATEYPWDGKVSLTIESPTAVDMTLKLRIPGWCQMAKAYVNGRVVDMQGAVQSGYLSLQRTWQPNDKVELTLDMSVQRIYARPDVRADAGKVALQRGPILYCIEEADNPISLTYLRLPKEGKFSIRFERGLLGGVVTLRAEGQAALIEDWGKQLYRTQPSTPRPYRFTAVPYYAWDNREPGQMTVWIQEA